MCPTGQTVSSWCYLHRGTSPPFQLHILIKSPQDTPSIPSTLHHRQSQFFLQDSLWICKKVTTSQMYFGRARGSQIGRREHRISQQTIHEKPVEKITCRKHRNDFQKNHVCSFWKRITYSWRIGFKRKESIKPTIVFAIIWGNPKILPRS